MNKEFNNLSIDAVILSGGKLDKALESCVDVPNKGLIKFAGRFMVDYVIDAVKSIDCISKISLVANKEILPDSLKNRVDYIASDGENIAKSLTSGIESLNLKPDYVLVMPNDMPLVSLEAIEDFIKRSIESQGDITYGYLSKEDSERKYPDVHHTYVKLKEGVFCGTGLFMMKPFVASSFEKMFDEITKNRKNPINLALMLGPVLVIKFLLKILSVRDAEKKVSKLMGNCNARAIRTHYADAGFNIDAPNELRIARKVLEEKIS